MKSKKQIQLIIDKAIEASFKEEKLIESKVLKFVKLFKSESKTESLMLLSSYLKALKYRLDSTTLLVEAAVPLSKPEVDKIRRKFSSEFKIINTQFKLDPSLLAGIRVKIGDQVFEDSIKSRINQVAQVIRS